VSGLVRTVSRGDRQISTPGQKRGCCLQEGRIREDFNMSWSVTTASINDPRSFASVLFPEPGAPDTCARLMRTLLERVAHRDRFSERIIDGSGRE
jgi:hypothetical protein